MGIGEFVKKNLQSEQKKRLVKKIGRRRDLQDVEFAIHAVSDFFNHLHMAFLGSKDRIRIFMKFLLMSYHQLEEFCEEILKIRTTRSVEKISNRSLMACPRLSIKDSNSVYWMEELSDIIHLRSAPLDVSQILESELFRKRFTCRDDKCHTNSK